MSNIFRKRQDKNKKYSPQDDEADEFVYDEAISVRSDLDVPSPEESPKREIVLRKRHDFDSDQSDSEESELQFELDDQKSERVVTDLLEKPTNSNYVTTIPRRNTSSKPGPSREHLASGNRPKSGIRSIVKQDQRPSAAGNGGSTDSSDSDSDDGLMMVEGAARGPIPGEYDPEQFVNLQVGDDVKEIFQYITKYTPQHLNLDYKFKPFIPDYIPAVGDIDAFLKVAAPEDLPAGLGRDNDDIIDNSKDAAIFGTSLGLAVLDEPAAAQSDSALLHLQLRALTVTTNKDNKNMIIKKVENVEKNMKTIDRWIKDVSDLHRAKPPPMVRYTNPMPDLDSLMQEWPQSVEMLLRKDGFPTHKLRCILAEYIDIVCAVFDIPVYEQRVQSLHVLFSLYIAIKGSQLYKSREEVLSTSRTPSGNASNAPDQLILE